MGIETRTFRVGDEVEWSKEMFGDAQDRLDLKKKHGEGPFTIKGVQKYSGHRCVECGSYTNEPADEIIDCFCPDNSGHEPFLYFVLDIGSNPQKGRVGAGWFVHT